MNRQNALTIMMSCGLAAALFASGCAMAPVSTRAAADPRLRVVIHNDSPVPVTIFSDSYNWGNVNGRSSLSQRGDTLEIYLREGTGNGSQHMVSYNYGNGRGARATGNEAFNEGDCGYNSNGTKTLTISGELPWLTGRVSCEP